MSNKKKKVRIELRKNRTKPPRGNDFTQQYRADAEATQDVKSGERVRAKGELSRHRTVVQGDEGAEHAALVAQGCVRGRVYRVQGLHNYVEAEGGQHYRCTVRRLLKSMKSDERSIVTTGDFVWVRPAGAATSELPEGTIEHVEPRHGVLTRASRNREHVLVANVDQVVIVMALAEPELKPHLVDRYIATAEKGDLKPIVCLNKIDLVNPVDFQPIIGMYAQLGIPTLFTSTRTGQGIVDLRGLLKDRVTVFSGQSGVGKSSLLNAVQPELGLQVKTVSESTNKGRHTTTTAEFIRLAFGGWVVDTPGVRQLQLWNTRPEEVEGYFREFHPFVPGCAFPNCTHTHEEKCAIKRAVGLHLIAEQRYTSYLGLFHGLKE
jgi:ribosome biogenesis GTPase